MGGTSDTSRHLLTTKSDSVRVRPASVRSNRGIVRLADEAERATTPFAAIAVVHCRVQCSPARLERMVTAAEEGMPSGPGRRVRARPDDRLPSTMDFSAPRDDPARRHNLVDAGLEQTDDERIGCCAVRAWDARRSAGKFRRFRVTITSACPRIAAATTWRSPASGRSSLTVRALYPVTTASGKCRSITARVLSNTSAERSGRSARRLRIHSAWISALHSGAYRYRSARRSRKSRSPAA